MKKSAAEAHRMLLNTYDEVAISERMCRGWFQRFKNGDFDVEDRHSSRREKVFKDAELEALLDQDSCQNQEELARSLGVTQQAISKRLKVMHDKVILQHDNARPHVVKVVKTYLETLKWEILPHLPYSPDVAPSDYHLFRSMTHDLADQHFRSYEEVKNHDKYHSYPRAAKIIKGHLYVDDLLTGTETIEETRKIRDKIIALLAKSEFVV
ncbi:MOS1T transposase, partial [Pseudoatta argentina]